MIAHATTLMVDGAGLMITGASGTGKSGLAIAMIALGARLVSDDRTILSRPDDGPPLAAAPEAITGLVEAWGLGLIRVDQAGPTRLTAVLDMSVIERERMPPGRTTDILGFTLPLLYRVETPWFPAALVLWSRTARSS